MTRTIRVVALALVIGLSASCEGGRASRPHSLVLITLDTTRADRLPAYGFESISTPALDRLAQEGVVFDYAMTVAPLTLTAHTSLFTGLYPPHHAVRDNADAPLDPSHQTLATILQTAGFTTGAFVGATVLGHDRGLAPGFDVYDDGAAPDGGRPARRRPGNQVVDHALAWLDTVSSVPFFLWVHLYDAHAPQAPPDRYRREDGDAYLAGIAFEDEQVGRVLGALEQRHLLETTAVVVAGDHGESLGEHGEAEHGIFVYDNVLHVPLIVRAPGVRPGRATGLVSLVDVLPTVRDLFGLPANSVDGESLLPSLERGRDPQRVGVYAESMYAKRFGWSPLRAVIEGRFEYIDAPRPELYDLDSDPFESHDLSSQSSAVTAAMRRELDILGGENKPGPEAPTTAEIRDRLKTLGYTSGTALASMGGPARDPKDYIETYNASRPRGLR